MATNNDGFLRYGDNVTLENMDYVLFVDTSDGKIKVTDVYPPTEFLLKHPTNPTNRDIILGGASVKMQANGFNAKVGSDGFIRCLETAEGPDLLRILDKHGKNKVKLTDGHYIKFREPGIAIDCSAVYGKHALNARLKESWQYYGFVMRRV
jgi:hypothetical protein